MKSFVILGGLGYEAVASLPAHSPLPFCLGQCFPPVYGRELLLERSERAQKRCLSEFECSTRTVPDYTIYNIGLTWFPKSCLFVAPGFCNSRKYDLAVTVIKQEELRY